jgi:hypothetical protein
MATCPTDSAVYQEEIRTFTFNGIDGITIPKNVREEAYEMAIDIIITSIARESYANYECTPAEGFYGNATLVMQDCLELKIPVKFPRQRIYYGRVPEAFEQWNALVAFEYHKSWHYWTAETVVALGTALGFAVNPPVGCCSLPEPTWRELPIREAYFHPPIGTQYQFEISWLKPVAFSDSCDTFFDGTSKQVDGDKDSGLPPNGIFPNIAKDEGDPYSGLPPVSTDFEQGAFSNSKVANLDDQNPELDFYPDDWGYFMQVQNNYRPTGHLCTKPPCNATTFWLCGELDTSFSLTKIGEGTVCGQTVNSYAAYGNSSGLIVSGILDFGSPTLTRIRAKVQPPNVINCT